MLQNIKRLLEMAFAKDEPISLMIHRVGKTLLIDEFDVHKHLMRRQQRDWKWMREFYNEIVSSQVGGLFHDKIVNSQVGGPQN